MDLRCLFFLLSLFILSQSQSIAPTFNATDLEAAAADMRSKSYHGFAILLQLLNGTTQLNRGITFFMPSDRELSKPNVSLLHLKDFLLSHSISKPLLFRDLSHLPTGTLVPSGLRGRPLKIANHGRLAYFVNNAQIVAPNVCINSLIRCHGVDATIQFNKNSIPKEYQEEHPIAATSPMYPPIAPMSNFFHGHD